MPSIFERIMAGEIPADVVYQDDHVMAIRDIQPQAPVHVIIFTRTVISGPAAVPETGDHLHLLNAARKVAEITGVAESGYRLVLNQGKEGGQSIDHLHVHLLGGRQMSWPPG